MQRYTFVNQQKLHIENKILEFMPIFKGSVKNKTQIHIAGKNYSAKTPKTTGNHCDKNIVFKKMYCTIA